MNSYYKNLAYIAGVALGDGNLSNPNGRAVRLRVTCDTRYPKIIKQIAKAIHVILPKNKVSIIKRAPSYIDISCYSNQWPRLLGWQVGSKYKQKVAIPAWIRKDKIYALSCLRGLFQTDGSIYYDRGYKMVNFVTTIPSLAKDVRLLISLIGFTDNMCVIKYKNNRKTRYNIRISKDVGKFIRRISLNKN